MSFYDDESGYRMSDPKHPTHANAAQGLREHGRPSGGLLRLKCMYCGAVFSSLIARELHFALEHGKGDAA